MKKTIAICLITLLGTGLLAGCSGGAPSASELQQAIQTQTRQQVAEIKKRFAKMSPELADRMRDISDVEVRDLEILDSEKMDNGDYKMELKFTVQAQGRNKTATTTMLVSRSDDGLEFTKLSP